MIGMSEIKTIQFLAYSIVAGLLWASTVSIVGYAAGRFFDLTPLSLEQNLLFIVLGFFLFGLFVGYFCEEIRREEDGGVKRLLAVGYGFWQFALYEGTCFD